ncbi:hypothetical protein FRC12_013720 [Ceratobasidium sp. 428]|nr:hypothetical protein FRC12_013720 [Ceratobasidium sp. 428]
MPYKPPPLGWESGPEEIIAPVGNNHFSVIEQNWIVENFMTEFLEVDGKRKVKQGKGAAESKATEADVFRQKIIAAFVETFPYRLPENAENQEFIPKLLELTWTDEEYGRAPQKLYSWLQKRKPDWAKGKVCRDAGGRSVSAPKIFYLSDHYRPDEEETKLEEETLRTLLRLLNGSWSSLDAEELKELREEIPTHMANILRTMSRIMGVEIVAYGAWEADKKLNVFDPRAKTFLADELSAWTRDELLNHLVASLGPNFSVDPEDVESTVHGNADRDFHPLLPTCPLPQLRLARQLDLWYNAKWRHQGGKHHVPYDLLQEDSENGVYALTSRERYPP